MERSMSLKELEELANKIANSTLLPPDLQGKPENILYVMLVGQELGLSPMQAIRSLYIEWSKRGANLTLTADAMLSLLYSLGVRFTTMRFTPDEAELHAVRPDGQEYYCKFTMEDAKRAGLAQRDMYQRYPDRMLRSRAIARVFRDLFPQIGSNIYTPEEIRDEEQASVETAVPSTHRFGQYVVASQEPQLEAEAQPEEVPEPPLTPEIPEEPKAEQLGERHQPPSVDVTKTMLRPLARFTLDQLKRNNQDAKSWYTSALSMMGVDSERSHPLEIAAVVGELHWQLACHPELAKMEPQQAVVEISKNPSRLSKLTSNDPQLAGFYWLAAASVISSNGALPVRADAGSITEDDLAKLDEIWRTAKSFSDAVDTAAIHLKGLFL